MSSMRLFFTLKMKYEKTYTWKLNGIRNRGWDFREKRNRIESRKEAMNKEMTNGIWMENACKKKK